MHYEFEQKVRNDIARLHQFSPSKCVVKVLTRRIGAAT
jgi:hypothetical protein